MTAMRQIVLDTETTGLSATQGDRIVEIGCIELAGRKPTGRHLHLHLNPERDIPEEASKIHGIRNEDVQGQPTFAQKAREILDWLQGAEIIIHNASFDVGFLDNELHLAGLPPFATHVAGIVDTLALAKEMYPGKRNSLDALCARLEVDNSERALHGALLDARLLADVYIRMTRSQGALLMEGNGGTGGGDAAAHSSQHTGVEQLDLSRIDVPIITASAQELAEHEAVLAHMDEESNGATLWRKTAAKTVP